jgi:hypothetical protein
MTISCAAAVAAAASKQVRGNGRIGVSFRVQESVGEVPEDSQPETQPRK